MRFSGAQKLQSYESVNCTKFCVGIYKYDNSARSSLKRDLYKDALDEQEQDFSCTSLYNHAREL